jgi:hypothetical protein
MPTSEDLWAKELNVREVSEASHAIRKGSQWVCLIRLIMSGEGVVVLSVQRKSQKGEGKARRERSICLAIAVEENNTRARYNIE